MDFREIGYGKTSVGSARGESSHQEHPFMALVSGTATQERGDVYGFHFVYSGNFLAQVEKTQFDSLRLQMGIHPKNFCWQLKPGEVFAAPEVILTYSAEGLGGMSRAYHDLYRNHLIRSPREPGPERRSPSPGGRDTGRSPAKPSPAQTRCQISVRLSWQSVSGQGQSGGAQPPLCACGL